MKNSNHKYTMAIDLITSWANSLSTLKTDSLIIRNIYDPPIATYLHAVYECYTTLDY